MSPGRCFIEQIFLPVSRDTPRGFRRHPPAHGDVARERVFLCLSPPRRHVFTACRLRFSLFQLASAFDQRAAVTAGCEPGFLVAGRNYFILPASPGLEPQDMLILRAGEDVHGSLLPS